MSEHDSAPNRATESLLGPASRTVVITFGVLAALAAVEHGVGEILQGPVPPPSLVFESWPEHDAFVPLSGEPALSLLPNLLVSGVLTILVAGAMLAWLLLGVHRRHGALFLVGLSLLLLAVGGGFGPPLLGLLLGLGIVQPVVGTRKPGRVLRQLGSVWPWSLLVGVIAYLALVPGTLIMYVAWGWVPDVVVYALIVLAFGGLIVSLIAARSSDQRAGAVRHDAPQA